MYGSIRIQVADTSQTADARRVARKMAEGIGFDTNQAERVAIVVTEVCTNLLKHAGGGEVLLSATAGDDGANNLSVLGLDRGSGMDMNLCLRDGYSTGGSPGGGLGAIIRQSDISDFYSVSAKGTAVLASWKTRNNGISQASPGRLRIGAVNVNKPGQEICGDSWGVEHAPGQTTIMVADGLGHGPDAHAASSEAVRTLHRHPELPPRVMIERVHQALRSTRGAAVAVARVDHEDGKVTYCGAGNIAGQLYRGSSAVQHMVSVNGTPGHQMDRLHEFTYPWPERGILIMHSDGLASSANIDSHAGLSLRDPEIIAAVLYRDFKRGYDDATVVVAKAE